MLLIEFHHFLVLASDAALPDLVNIWPGNFYFNIYVHFFSIFKSSYLREAVI